MKKVYRILAIVLILCSLIFYVPKIEASYANTGGNSDIPGILDPFNPEYNYTYYTKDGYTNVLDDLKSTEEFSDLDYLNQSDEVQFVPPGEEPQQTIQTDPYTPTVFHIAEGDNNELFIYVYLGCARTNDLRATAINMSVREDRTNYHLYNLECVSIYEVLYKYRVLNYQVSNDSVRHYMIASIYREPIELDNVSEDVTEVSFRVGKRYVFKTENEKTSYTKFEEDVIVITSKFVGYVRYKDTATPSWIDKNSCDRHFVAFTTDKRMDKLLEAEVYYTRQDLNIIYGRFPSYDSKIEDYAYLKHTEQTQINNSDYLFWGGYNYTWDRIQTVNDFISSVDMTTVYSKGLFDVSSETKINEDSLQELEQKEWVLSFCETDYSDYWVYAGDVTYKKEERTIVGDVSILRLYFETDGVRYNLGAVDNKQNEKPEPINTNDVTVSLGGRLGDSAKEIWNSIKMLLGIIAIILIISLLAPFLPTIFSLILFILKGIISIIALPFKFIKKKKRKGKK